MNYAEALTAVLADPRTDVVKIARSGWKNVLWVTAQWPDEHSKMTGPYLYTRTADGKNIPWLCSQGDAFADDWYLRAP